MLTMIGTVHAQTGCLGDICITTDRASQGNQYSPGDTVTFNVKAETSFENSWPSGVCFAVGINALSYEVGFVPYSVLALEGGAVLTWDIPDNATAGSYTIFGGESCSGPWFSGFGDFQIVAGVPETPSVVALLLPAMLVGIYVLRRKNLTAVSK